MTTFTAVVHLTDGKKISYPSFISHSFTSAMGRVEDMFNSSVQTGGLSYTKIEITQE